ncbi:MAG: hypothetical protein H7227_00450 [Actinobacteria bacterium]|nr:hypothetical protein [Actinomycetota bacterium]
METETATSIVETDARSRVVLPGHSNRRYIMEDLPDGAILLQPAVVVSEAQLEYLSTPELRDLLSRAATSKTVARPRRQRRPE